MPLNKIPQNLIQLLNQEIIPFSVQDKSIYKILADKIGDSRIVLMGEATHGTEEFYQARIELSKHLITEKKFSAIAIEGDWTSVYPVHQYLQDSNKGTNPESSLSRFDRFPTWMWRNTTLPPFLKWLRNYNDNLNDPLEKIGMYGLDLYCLTASMQGVIEYLKHVDPKAAEKAIRRYSCFDYAGGDPQMYGYFVESNIKKACIKEVMEQYLEMQHFAFEKMEKDFAKNEELFYALQNARLIKNAEHYYRALFDSREETWNIRDNHMLETLQNIISHIENKTNAPAKIIIWAHNSHVGDARATEMNSRGEINLGQLVREHFSNTSFHLGFSTYTGTVTAASKWDGPPELKKINPAIPGSYESIFHELRIKNFLFFLHDGEIITHLLDPSRLQRAIGVLYLPSTERQSHYFFARLPLQFDALIHIDETQGVSALE